MTGFVTNPLRFYGKEIEIEIRFINPSKTGCEKEIRFTLSWRHILCKIVRHWSYTFDGIYATNQKACRLCSQLLDYGTPTEAGIKLRDRMKS